MDHYTLDISSFSSSSFVLATVSCCCWVEWVALLRLCVAVGCLLWFSCKWMVSRWLSMSVSVIVGCLWRWTRFAWSLEMEPDFWLLLRVPSFPVMQQLANASTEDERSRESVLDLVPLVESGNDGGGVFVVPYSKSMSMSVLSRS